VDLTVAIRCFIRVVETGSFSAVARESRISQSAVTRQIDWLEQHFRARLFHRTTRQLSLTDDGHSLLPQARHLVDIADAMEATLGGQSHSPTGLVRLGTSIAGGLVLAPRIPVLLARHPGLRVELVMRDQSSHDLVADRLDLDWRVGDIGDASLVARRVGEVGRAVVAAPAYLRRNSAPSVPDDLASHTCLIHSSTPDPNTWSFTGANGPLSVHVNGALIANDSVAVLRAARAGHGIALLAEVMVMDDLHAGRLCRLLIDYPSRTEPVHIVYPSRRNLAPRTRVVLDFVVEQSREIQALLKTRAELTPANQ
jgi:DNA-binding transcriptional LysR family regulator